MNFNKLKNKHYIKLDGYAGGFFAEGFWESFIERDEYKDKKKEDSISYFWDDIIQKTCGYALEERLIGNSTPLDGRSAIHEMAKEPRFIRRELSKIIIKAIENFPEPTHEEPFARKLSLIPSFYKNKAYLFLQLHDHSVTREEYRQGRQKILEIACGAAKNKFSHFATIVGIAIEPPKYNEMVSEDFILMDCADWTEEQKRYYETENEYLNFFKTPNLKIYPMKSTEFPENKKGGKPKRIKTGRNDPCPCGSGKKYKKCCIDMMLV